MLSVSAHDSAAKNIKFPDMSNQWEAGPAARY